MTINFITQKAEGVKMISIRSLLFFIGIAVICISTGMYFPLLGSTFSPYYGTIAKNIIITNSWNDLMLSGVDWLDKPHLPFWITAVFFKIFGVGSFGYILPGFICNLIGAVYTYKISSVWYDKKTSTLSSLLYLTTLHLMLSAIDVRAEAYLLAEIIPAAYYLLQFNLTKRFKYLIIAGFFTGLALMTKGLFVLVTIGGGVICLWVYTKQFKNFINYKWWIYVLLSLLVMLPEVIALYRQFDLHPTKIIFSATHVSGVKWFFWGSQFGRFFNNGPIASSNHTPLHWLFFIHTFLWAFLPWWPIFFYTVFRSIKNFINNKKHQYSFVFLFGSFIITFLLFSATSFQVDHYTNIIFPFACILCAKQIMEFINNNKVPIWILVLQVIFIVLFFVVSFTFNYILFNKVAFLVLLLMLMFFVGLTVFMWIENKLSTLLIFAPISGILILFITLMCINGMIYVKYDIGFNLAKSINKESGNVQLIGYKIDSMPLKSLELYSKFPIAYVDNLDNITKSRSAVIVLPVKYLDILKNKQHKSLVVMKVVSGCEFGVFLNNLYKLSNIKNQLDEYVIVRVNYNK